MVGAYIELVKELEEERPLRSVQLKLKVGSNKGEHFDERNCQRYVYVVIQNSNTLTPHFDQINVVFITEKLSGRKSQDNVPQGNTRR